MRTGTRLFGCAAACLFATFSLHAAGSCWLRDAASPAPSTVYAMCEQGTFWITTDGGAKWTSRETAAKMPLRALTFLDANRGLVVGDGERAQRHFGRGLARCPLGAP